MTRYRRPSPPDPARVARHRLIRELLADDIAAGIVPKRRLEALFGYCDRRDLDHHAVCIIVRRLQSQRGRGAWEGVLAAVGRVEVSNG